MRDQKEYDAIVVVTPKDFSRLRSQHRRIVEMLPVRRVLFVGSREVGALLEQELTDGVFPGDLRERVGFVSENDILPFDGVHALVSELGERYHEGRQIPRNVTGWYYQQFLKFAYADFCKDEYYMAWDGDTVPCKDFSMFSDTGLPYLDYKREFHEEYFTTMKNLLGLFKVIEPSFISEHMLFRCDLVHALEKKMEANEAVAGTVWWEKILHAIRPGYVLDNSFSEFETYGTFVALTAPGAYRLREWHSFRYAAEFFNVDEITDRDYHWLSRDFAAASFEKNMSIREDNGNLFSNPQYQEKLSARQMLEVAQQEFKGGAYLEQWDIAKDGTEKKAPSASRPDRLRYLADDTYLEYEQLGDRLAEKNADQAWLCYENAAFLSPDDGERERLTKKKEQLAAEREVVVQKTCILILSYNQQYMMEKCLESIFDNCAPDAFSLLVFDNASTDGVADWLKGYAENRDMTLVLSDENLGFVGGCNAAAAYASPEEDLLLLNNDTRLPANALFWLRMGLYAAGDIGATGAVQNYDASKEQWENVEFPLPEQYLEYGARRNVEMYAPCEKKSKLSGFAMLIRSGLFHELGGFDERFAPGYFEDDDLSFRIRERGLRLMVCYNSFIYHAGSQSFRKREDLRGLIRQNLQKFIDKWGFDSWQEDRINALDPAKIKLIVWDLDNTFWEGIFSEEEVTPVPENMALVRLAVDKGIMNSICSKNDLGAVQAALASEKFGNIWECFVFPSADWTPKSPRLKQMIEDMALRPENVLFVDDELINLREAHQELPDLQVAEPDILGALAEKLTHYEGAAPGHQRLDHYRLLEKKREKQKTADSSEAFLRQSDIRVIYRYDCARFAARIHELLGRTNQLNFTKERPAREEVDTLLRDDAYECAVVQARDVYGDYGEVGFYAIERGEPHTLRHFAFSCRAMGMGIEQYTYQRLGFPPLTVVGETAVTLKKEQIVDWITEETWTEDAGEAAPDAGADGERREITEAMPPRKILLKGPCDIDGMASYFSHDGDMELEANFVDDRGIVVAGSNNSIHLYEAYHVFTEEIRKTIERAPFLCEADFITFMFQEAYDAVIFSTLSEGHSGVYRDKENGMKICFGSCNFDLTNPANWDKFISGEYVNHNIAFTKDFLRAFAEHFVFEGHLDPVLSVRNLQWMREKLPAKTKLILLLGSEIEAEENTPEFAEHAPIYRALNEKIREAFTGVENVALINVTDYITGQDCFEGSTNHFSRLVYQRLAEAVEAVL